MIACRCKECPSLLLSSTRHERDSEVIDDRHLLRRECVGTLEIDDTLEGLPLHDKCPTQVTEDLRIIRYIHIRNREDLDRSVEVSSYYCDISLEIDTSTRCWVERASISDHFIGFLEIVLEYVDIGELLVETIVISMTRECLESSHTRLVVSGLLLEELDRLDDSIYSE
jgi:hypothetical protein